ncbi:MAG: murein L,D-transpeptidase [Planctomycetes bacterium]|nr:murein L,D-transpeptidase [Planctomycetota bacterium]
MLPLIKSLLFRGVITAAVLGLLFTVFFLEEWPQTDLRRDLGARERAWPPEDLWVEISLQRMVCEVKDGEEVLWRFDIGFGRGAIGRANAEVGGTPLGEYRILSKERRTDMFGRGARFMRIDYPNEEDADRAVASGAISPEDCSRIFRAHAVNDAPPTDTPLGGPLGLQGNLFAFVGRRFTDGSVALDNGDLIGLYEVLPVGTRVVITDH